MKEISVKELKAKMDADENIELIDVRQPNEYEFARIEGAKLIPLAEIIDRKDEIDQSKEVYIHCKSGGRSARAIQALAASGVTADMYNVVGGITAWSNEIDPTVPKYN